MPIPDDTPCRQFDDLRLAMVDEADPAMTAALAAHLETCLHCQQVDLDVTSLLDIYRQRTPDPLDTEREDRLLSCMCGPTMRTDPPSAPDSIR